MEALLEEIIEQCAPYKAMGKPASYIPELAKGDVNNLGMYVMLNNGQTFKAGDYKKPFTIQSVVKPILLLLALMDHGMDEVRKTIGVEATGKPFDAINVTDQNLEQQHGKGKILIALRAEKRIELPALNFRGGVVNLPDRAGIVLNLITVRVDKENLLRRFHQNIGGVDVSD